MSVAECTSSEEDCREGSQAVWVQGAATGTVFAGAIAGQLVMGFMGDVLGRNRAMCLTLTLTTLGALGSALAFGDPTAIYVIIIICRFILGVGVGGIYPLSATKAAEDAADEGSVNTYASSMSFFWQQPGAMGPWFIGYLLTYSNEVSTSFKWRIILAIGGLCSGMVTVLSMIEIQQESKHQPELSQGLLQEDPSTSGDSCHIAYSPQEDKQRALSTSVENTQAAVRAAFQNPKVLSQLVGTCGGWFLFDIAYFGVTLCGGLILDAMKEGDDDNVSSDGSLRYAAVHQLIALAVGIPAALITILLLKPLGLKYSQIYGFLFIAACFVIMALTLYPLKDSNPDALFVVYCGLLFALSAGPNVTTYILPTAVFDSKVSGFDCEIRCKLIVLFCAVIDKVNI